MESMTVYLRDYNKVVGAWKLYRESKAEGSDDTEKLKNAITVYQEANYNIDELAHGWDMDFVIVCGLVDQYPKDHPHWDGPFCGAFFITVKQERAPFIGLAFKGTNPTRKPDRQVDIDYDQRIAGQYALLNWRIYGSVRTICPAK